MSHFLSCSKAKSVLALSPSPYIHVYVLGICARLFVRVVILPRTVCGRKCAVVCVWV